MAHMNRDTMSEEIHQPVVRRSIRTRLVVLLLGLATVSVLTVGYLGVDSVQDVGESAQRISAGALRSQAEEYLRQVVVGDARRNDLILKRIQGDAANLAQYAAGIFGQPDAFTSGAYWRAEDHMFVGPDGQYMNDETGASSVFVPDFADVDEELQSLLELSAYLDFVFAPTYENDANTVAIYLGMEREVTRYYPNVNLGTLIPPDFQITQRPWYVSVVPESNPERAVVWSPVYVDATGQGLMVTAAAPVYAGGDEFVGAIGIDVTLGDISVSIEETRLLGSGYSFLLDETGHAIVLPERGYRDILGRDPELDEVWADLSGVTTEFAPVLEAMMAGSVGFDTLEVGGTELLVAYAPLESTGWSLANVVDAEAVLQTVGTLQTELEASSKSLVLARILPLGGGILAVATLVGLFFTVRLVDPIKKLATAAVRVGAGEWDVALPPAGDDEIGALARVFGMMVAQIQELVSGLEQRVAERTRTLERRATQMEAAALVARDAAEIRDVNQLLDETVRLISEHFGFYHAGIFLLDDQGEYAVLQAASSRGGQRMLARAHKLKVGEVGIVGYAAGTGNPRIALDVGADAVFFDNPDLPETRSEMALPLKVRERVIGVLDVQSTEGAAFSNEDVATLQIMADQVALAIESARLLDESRSALRELESLYGRRTRESWQERVSAYRYTGVRVEQVPSLSLPELEDSLSRQQPAVVREVDGPRLVAPIRLRGQVIGSILLRQEPDQAPWSSDELALIDEVSTQIGLALENARLLEETQKRAEQEQMLGEMTARFTRSLDVDGLLRAAVRELGRLLPVEEVSVHVIPPEETRSAPADEE